MALTVKSRRAEVLVESRRRHRGQSPGPVVGLAAGAREVDREAIHPNGRGAEAVVRARLTAEPLGHVVRDRDRVPLDGQVEVHRACAEQQVADGPPDQVRRVEAVQRGQQRFHPGKGLDTRTQGLRHRRQFYRLPAAN